MMKSEYSSPDFEIVRISITNDVLAISDPESSIPSSGSGANPDPFSDLP